MVAGVSLVGCKNEELNSNEVTEKRDPNLISVSLDMSAGVQDSIAETDPKHQGRALSYTLEDGEKDGKKSFSILKFNTEKAPETLEAYGIFYCPSAPQGKKVYISYYSKREQLRHTVRPGITGLAQVNGRNKLNWDDRLELDAQYVENLSFLLDIKILFRTIVNVLLRKDIAVGYIDLDDYRKNRNE